VPGAALFVRLLARTGCGGCLLASFANASTSLASNASPRPLPAHFATFWWAASRSSTCPSASCNSLLGSILLFHCFWQPFGQAALRCQMAWPQMLPGALCTSPDRFCHLLVGSIPFPSASCNPLLGSILLFQCFLQPFGQAALRSTLPIYRALFD
jgi:hypothetical protein